MYLYLPSFDPGPYKKRDVPQFTEKEQYIVAH